jgi:hypothetical protein
MIMKKKVFSSLNWLLLFSLGNIGCWSPNWETEPLPTEFKAYQTLNTHYNADNYKVELLAKTETDFPSPIRAFENGHGEMIVEATKVRNNVIIGDDYLKLNKDGKVTDTLSLLSGDGFDKGFVGDFTLFISDTATPYYTTWPLNGDTTKRKIEILNNDLSWAEEKLTKTTRNILTTAKYTFYTISYPRETLQDETCYKQLFFLRITNGRCCAGNMNKQFT